MGSLTIEQFKTLCDYDDVNDIYISKKGTDYINSLSNVFNLKNKNDKPFTEEDIIKQPTIDEFNFSGVQEFQLICDLYAEPMKIKNNKRTNEKIIPVNFISKNAESIFKNSKGVVYMITCIISGKEYIIKIGETRTPFKNRLQSYNCGCVNNWRTASTTNIKILQSLLTTRLTYELYIYDCSQDMYSIIWNGVQSIMFASPMSLAIEDIMVKQFYKIFNKKPLANIQANATN